MRRFNYQLERLLGYHFDPKEAAAKVFQSAAVGYGLTYGSKTLDPATAALFCGLSELVAQIALPVLYRALDKLKDNRLGQGALWAAYVISRLEIPRLCFLLSGSELQKYRDYSIAFPLMAYSWGITGGIRLFFETCCPAPQRRLFDDPFLDEHIQ